MIWKCLEDPNIANALPFYSKGVNQVAETAKSPYKYGTYEFWEWFIRAGE